MRALPGREARSTLEPDRGLTRDTLAESQRRRIRRATGELVAKRGYPSVTIELIVKRAKVGFKTFYKHYGNKQEAFIDLFDVAIARTEEEVREAIAEADGEWPEQVAVALRAFFESIIAEPLIARACLVEAPTAGPEVLARYEVVARAFVPILIQGRKYSPEAASLPDSIEDILAGSVLWSAYQRLVLSEADRIADLIPENIELLLRPYIGEQEAAAVGAAAFGPADG
jgi:AcrR family transcriptional regulator